MDTDYHNPYDHRPLGLKNSTNNSDSDQTANHYEAPSCLVRNPSGSLFIPSSGKYHQSQRLALVKLNCLMPTLTFVQKPRL